LGDAVLELISTHFLYDKFPDNSEGDLTAYRAALVNAVTCAEIATEIGMNDYLLLSRGEARTRPCTLYCSRMPLRRLGAIYIDKGYDAAKDFINEHLFPKIEEIVKNKTWRDPKSALQEKVQELKARTPYYSVIKETVLTTTNNLLSVCM
jgi:ribonuclease-3